MTHNCSPRVGHEVRLTATPVQQVRASSAPLVPCMRCGGTGYMRPDPPPTFRQWSWAVLVGVLVGVATVLALAAAVVVVGVP